MTRDPGLIPTPAIRQRQRHWHRVFLLVSVLKGPFDGSYKGCHAPSGPRISKGRNDDL